MASALASDNDTEALLGATAPPASSDGEAGSSQASNSDNTEDRSSESRVGAAGGSGDQSQEDRTEASGSGLGGAAAAAAAAASLKDDEDSEKAAAAAAAFECNICLDVASDAVISMCGHLFCWPCLHTWLETRPQRQICPVCKAGIGKDKVVPIYGRGDSNPKDPRDKPLPPRPRGQRPEPETSGGGGGGVGFGGFGGGGGGGVGGGFQMSFGIGAFPFGFFATNFNLGDGPGGRVHGPQEGTAQYEEEQFLHKAFLWVAFAFIFWLLIA